MLYFLIFPIHRDRPDSIRFDLLPISPLDAACRARASWPRAPVRCPRCRSRPLFTPFPVIHGRPFSCRVPLYPERTLLSLPWAIFLGSHRLDSQPRRRCRRLPPAATQACSAAVLSPTHPHRARGQWDIVAGGFSRSSRAAFHRLSVCFLSLSSSNKPIRSTSALYLGTLLQRYFVSSP